MANAKWCKKLFVDCDEFLNWLNEGIEERGYAQNYLRDPDGQPLLRIIPTNDSCIEIVYLMK